MFLHLGSNTIVSKQDIVVILNLETTKQSPINSEFIRLIQGEGRLQSIAEPGKEKTFVLTSDQGFLSPISAATLARRIDNLKEIQGD
ncbi:MAG: DUF370 domain-containing protein [Firmicutes bacterium]|nr:DUF370 domain-containing protein [Bacillota bacterium]